MDCYTYKRRPVKLMYTAEFGDVNEAIAWEKKVKRWSRRKKEALIAGNWSMISEFALCVNGTSHIQQCTIACHTERSRSATCKLLHRTSLDSARDDKL